METIADRLVQARKRANYKTGSDAARAFGWPVSTYLGHENGDRVPKPETVKRYARAFRASWTWILDGGSTAHPSTPTIPVVGYVGAGAEVFPIDDHEKGDGIDEIEAPPGASRDAVSVRVRGDSMWPVYHDGDSIVFDSRLAGGDLHSYVGRECIVKLEDGRTFIKTLARGSDVGLWTLLSYNAPPLTDVNVEWAARVKWIARR